MLSRVIPFATTVAGTRNTFSSCDRKTLGSSTGSMLLCLIMASAKLMTYKPQDDVSVCCGVGVDGWIRSGNSSMMTSLSNLRPWNSLSPTRVKLSNSSSVFLSLSNTSSAQWALWLIGNRESVALCILSTNLRPALDLRNLVFPCLTS